MKGLGRFFRSGSAYIIIFLSVITVALAGEEQFHLDIKADRVIDLTQPLYNGMPYWPGTEPIEIERLADYDKGYRMHRFSMWENIGTHVDSPSHFAAGQGKRTIDQLKPEDLILPLVMIDVRSSARQNDDYMLSVADIESWEKLNGKIEPGTLVLMNTGWSSKFANPAAYVNQDADGVLHFPGFSVEAARLLVKRNVAGIGIDTMSLDPGNDLSFPVHNIMLAANKFQVENMTNLNLLPAKGAVAFIGVLPVRDGSQAQARILAVINSKNNKQEMNND